VDRYKRVVESGIKVVEEYAKRPDADFQMLKAFRRRAERRRRYVAGQ
jgi:hypothetical protein